MWHRETGTNFFFGGTGGFWTQGFVLAKHTLLWLFRRWDLWNYLPMMALNLNPPNLSLPSN
jgi:hypothetical protein